jgi:hypothetical protein
MYSFHHPFHTNRESAAGRKRRWLADRYAHARVAPGSIEVLDAPLAAHKLPSETALRAAASTVANARPQEISATRVTGVLGLDDLATFEVLVARLADEYQVEASVRIEDRTFAVRFSRPGLG